MFTSLVQVYDFKMSTNRLGHGKMLRSEVRGGEERSVRVGGGGKKGAVGEGGGGGDDGRNRLASSGKHNRKHG